MWPPSTHCINLNINRNSPDTMFDSSKISLTQAAFEGLKISFLIAVLLFKSAPFHISLKLIGLQRVSYKRWKSSKFTQVDNPQMIWWTFVIFWGNAFSASYFFIMKCMRSLILNPLTCVIKQILTYLVLESTPPFVVYEINSYFFLTITMS